MTVSISIIVAVVGSIVAWLILFLIIAMLMFGDDKAFSVSAVGATVIIVLYWLHTTGIIEVVP